MKTTLFVCLLIFTLHSETHLSGDISTISFNPAYNPFIVDNEIIIPANKKVSIDAGCVLLFNPYTGLSVYGRLEVIGQVSNNVVFTSINDPVYNPAAASTPQPFDWNGVVLHREISGAIFNNAQVSYSVFGIKAISKCISLHNVLFTANGQYNLTIYDKIIEINNNQPFSWSPLPETISPSAFECIDSTWINTSGVIQTQIKTGIKKNHLNEYFTISGALVKEHHKQKLNAVFLIRKTDGRFLKTITF